MPKKITKAKAKLPKEDMSKAVKRSVSGVPVFSDASRHWYDLPEDKIAGAIHQLVIEIDRNNNDIKQDFERYARMYGNYENLGFNNAGYDAFTYDGSTNLPTYNVIQSSVDTLLSKITKDNPQPYFITSGGDYFEKLKAEKLTQFMQGVFQYNELYDKANNSVCRDGMVYGLGGLRFEINKQTNMIDAEWIFIDELKIDRIDAMKKEPRSIHLCYLMQKEMLEQKFQDKQDIIDNLSTQHPEYFRSKETVVEFIVVIESWHLRNGDKPGRHVISIQDKTLLDEDYMEDWFPLAFFRYYDKPAGMYGRGIPDTLFNNQIEINKILLMIQQCQELQAAPVIFVPTEAQVAPDVLLSNNISRAIPYRGSQPPTFAAPQAVDPAVYQHLQWWITNSYQEVGISQMTAGGTKQPGVNSAIAMRTMVDIESSRFIQVSKNWEKFFIDCAEICVKLAKKAYENDNTFKVTYMDKKSKILKEIPWKKVNLPDDMFSIRCDTISGFPASAAGRIQTVTDLISNHFIGQERGMELLNIDPDLEDEIKLQTSTLRLCEKRLCEMVEDNVYNHPENYMNLKLAQLVSQQTYNQLQIDGCPEERLSLVRQWINEIANKIAGNDPDVIRLQALFQPPQAAQPTPVAPQASLNPANVQPQQ